TGGAGMTGRRQRRRGRDGFTLIEVLAAMALFAIVASGAGALAIQSMKHIASNRHGMQAVILAQEDLERVRGMAYTDIAPDNYTDTVDHQDYRITRGIEANTPAANMTRVTVTITWTGPEGSKSYVVQTIFTQLTG